MENLITCLKRETKNLLKCFLNTTLKQIMRKCGTIILKVIIFKKVTRAMMGNKEPSIWVHFEPITRPVCHSNPSCWNAGVPLDPPENPPSLLTWRANDCFHSVKNDQAGSPITTQPGAAHNQFPVICAEGGSWCFLQTDWTNASTHRQTTAEPHVRLATTIWCHKHGYQCQPFLESQFSISTFTCHRIRSPNDKSLVHPLGS